jgi:hypothetical protein
MATSWASGNPLPEDQVARYIDGRAEVKAPAYLRAFSAAVARNAQLADWGG